MAAPPTPNSDLVPRLAIAVLGAILGSFGTVFIERFKNRLLILRKDISYQLVGMSTVSDRWGDIKILWNDGPVKNLYVFNAEIINPTSRDVPKDMVITFSVEEGSYFLRWGGTLYHGEVAMGLKLENEYFQQFQDVGDRWNSLPPEQRTPDSPIHQEVRHITRHKKFVVPILNRGSKATFDFLIGCDTGNTPTLIIGIYEPGIDLRWHESKQKAKRRKIWLYVIAGIIYIGLFFPIIAYAPSKTWVACLMVLNSWVSAFSGKGIVYLMKLLRLV